MQLKGLSNQAEWARCRERLMELIRQEVARNGGDVEPPIADVVRDICHDLLNEAKANGLVVVYAKCKRGPFMPWSFDGELPRRR